MGETNVRDNFIRAYDSCADDIFAYCYEKTAERDVAKYLTRNIFTDAWDSVAAYGQNIENMQRFIWEKAKENIASFLSIRRNHEQYSEKLWRLTLSQ